MNVTENKGATEAFQNGEVVNKIINNPVNVDDDSVVEADGNNKQTIKSLCRPLTVPK